MLLTSNLSSQGAAMVVGRGVREAAAEGGCGCSGSCGSVAAVAMAAPGCCLSNFSENTKAARGIRHVLESAQGVRQLS